jgi:hypothetical protein
MWGAGGAFFLRRFTQFRDARLGDADLAFDPTPEVLARAEQFPHDKLGQRFSVVG